MRIVPWVIGCASVMLGCSSDDGVFEDQGFDLWCGSELCSWDTEEGRIARVGTWHAKDYGVELVEAPTVLSQHIEASTACLKLRVVANIEREASVSLVLDLRADREVDHSEPLPRLSWEPLELLVGLPADGLPLRVVLHKENPGKVIFAELSADTLDGCPNAPIQVGSGGP